MDRDTSHFNFYRWMFVILLVISIGLGVAMGRLSSRINDLQASVNKIDQSAEDARNASEEASEILREAVRSIDDPEEAAQLQRVFEAVFDIERIIMEEFGE